MSLIGRVKGVNKDEKRDLASFVSLKFHCALSALFVCVCVRACLYAYVHMYVYTCVCVCLCTVNCIVCRTSCMLGSCYHMKNTI